LHTDAVFVDAAAAELGKFEETIQLGADGGESLIAELDPEAVVDCVTDFFAEIENAEVVPPANVNAKIKGWLD